MGLISSCFKKKKKEWILVLNLIENPKYIYIENDEIYDSNYFNILKNLLNDKNIIKEEVINQVIGNSRYKDPRLLRVAKLIKFENENLYDGLQFLSTIYPKVYQLLNGYTYGYHGFTKIYKKNYLVSFTDDRFFKFNIDTDNVYFFNQEYNIRTPVEHNCINKLSWCSDSVKSINMTDIPNKYSKKINIKFSNIDTCINYILRDLGNYTKENYNTLNDFIKFIFRLCKKTHKLLEFTFCAYTTEHYVIRNGNIPDLIDSECEKQNFVSCVNTLDYFKDEKVSYMNIFGDTNRNYKLVDCYEKNTISNFNTKKNKLIKFYNDYTIFDKYDFKSNLNKSNIIENYTLSSLD